MIQIKIHYFFNLYLNNFAIDVRLDKLEMLF
jgi:hypothetical protein